jgi:hypothetical protein
METFRFRILLWDRKIVRPEKGKDASIHVTQHADGIACVGMHMRQACFCYLKTVCMKQES